uniref:F-box/LRR-repeat protein 12-like n=1 Tax=Phallusia mammillata TaxID=59560 RepID=A0A6F9DCT1_9ASCI|nr:F-box/LRR-repeat protein 12-like [Phallusia mammillata]
MTEKHLKCFGKLEKLEFYGCYRIDHDAVQVITTNFPNLHTLVMVGCAWCNDQSCRDIATRLNKLRSFEMEEWLDLTQTGVDYLLRHSKHLKFFSNKCKQLNNGGLAIHGSRVDV